MLADGFPHDAVDAVLAEQGQNPTRARRGVQELIAWRKKENWEQLLQAFARCARITRGEQELYAVEVDRFEDEIERQLYDEIKTLQEQDRPEGSVSALLEDVAQLVPLITAYFEDVLVMAEDEQLRRSRLGTLQRIVQFAEGVLDFSRLEGF
jgi:glycyl-tRNA synthetase beta subunit